MNVIISNKQQALLANLNIEIIKTINGVFTTDEIVNMFSNFFFGRMILDLTALNNYRDIRNLQKISISLPVEKIIVLLPSDDAEVNSPQFTSMMISMGIYNFTKDLNGINYLLQNPNSYRDVAHLHQIQEPLVVERTVVVPEMVNNSQQDMVMEDNMSMNYNPVQHMILGIKNLTDGAGSTTLCYLLKKELKKRDIPVIAVEVERRDFTYLNDKELVSVTKEGLGNFLTKNREAQVILVDLNSADNYACTDTIYLLEPSYIKLNRLMMKDRGVFERLKNEKIILSQNMLSHNDVEKLEREAKIKFFYTIPSLDDRKDNEEVLSELLEKLGII